jgi:hypothetical protein
MPYSSIMKQKVGMRKTKGRCIVAGKKALVATSTVTMNGKGIVLSTPLKVSCCGVFRSANTGEYELQFTVPDDGRIDDKSSNMFCLRFSSFNSLLNPKAI